MYSLKRSDWWWLAAYPLYQLIGTLRHEGSHVVGALLEGVHIDRFVFWPTLGPPRFRFGYVVYGEPVGWLATAFPYLVDLILFIVFFLIVTRFSIRPRWLWLQCVIVGLISPFLNTLYNYGGVYFWSNDVAKLLRSDELPDAVIHVYFLIVLLIYGAGLARLFRRPATMDS